MIGFVQPWALLGLPLVAIPLLVHLVQRRDPPEVIFPAVRYLRQASEEHQRRLRIRHLLLLLVRTALVLFLVLAAASPITSGGTSTGHAPSSLVVVLDNSPSSGAVSGGTLVLTDLRAALRNVLDRATAADHLWLLAADGVARRGQPAELIAEADSLPTDWRRLDLGDAVAQAEEVLSGETRPRGIVVISDFQSSALSPVRPRFPVIAVRPSTPPPRNAGIGSIDAGPQPWAGGGGVVEVRLAAAETEAVPITVTAGDRTRRDGIAASGEGTVALGALPPGWWRLVVTKPADEFRLDDERAAVVHVVNPARVSCAATGRHLSAACAVLTDAGRMRPGDELTLGGLGRGPSVVMPPEAAADLGALNRAIERHGSGWKFGGLVAGEAVTDSGQLVGRARVFRRVELVPTGTGPVEGIVATVSGRPWIVQSRGLVLVGSRLEPEWTDLPLSAAFPGLVDALANRIARGDVVSLRAVPGQPVRLPSTATAVARGDRTWPVEGGAAFHPREPGAYFVIGARDTIGGLSVGIDPRESALARATDDAIATAWPGARVVDLAEAATAAFAVAGSRSLQGPLLWLALLLAACELLLAGGRRPKA